MQRLKKDDQFMVTASMKEKDSFARLADEWWVQDGEFKSLHDINPIRLTYVRDQICEHYRLDKNNINCLNKISILDVGCGGGLICEPMVRLGADVTGIDPVPEAIEIAKSHAKEMGLSIDYHNILPEKFRDYGYTYDVIINMEVIEHVTDIETFLMACVDLLKPGGLMVSATLNRTLKSLIIGKFIAEYVLKWVPAGTHDWKKFIKPSEFSSYLRRFGLSLVDISGFNYYPHKGCWGISKNIDVNYFLTAEKPKIDV